jgi:hypothetical protein
MANGVVRLQLSLPISPKSDPVLLRTKHGDDVYSTHSPGHGHVSRASRFYPLPFRRSSKRVGNMLNSTAYCILDEPGSRCGDWPAGIHLPWLVVAIYPVSLFTWRDHGARYCFYTCIASYHRVETMIDRNRIKQPDGRECGDPQGEHNSAPNSDLTGK